MSICCPLVRGRALDRDLKVGNGKPFSQSILRANELREIFQAQRISRAPVCADRARHATALRRRRRRRRQMSMSAARHHYGGRIDIIWPKRGMKNQFVFCRRRDNDKNEAWKKKKQLASCRTSSSWLGSSQWESLSHYVAALPSGACSSSQRRPCVAFSRAGASRSQSEPDSSAGGRRPTG